MYIGVDYYPEHWPQDRWETDAKLMREAGFNVVRLAEFAWANLEPEEGKYEFDWLDDALAILHRNNISAILGTPTATMPAWLAHRYPAVMAQDKHGQKLVWGVRKNNCLSSETYRQFSRLITTKLATHYNNTANVIGWQTDNEFGDPVCFCASCLAEFQGWLREKYNTLDQLNQAWGTHFWSQTYRAWGEIQFPVDDASYNPSLLLDHKRFNSWLNVCFQREQVDILRKYCPDHFVTHNLMGLYPHLNYYDLAKDLDFVSWDNYPVWREPAMPAMASAAADLMRGVKGKNFWIMETTAGTCGWGEMGRNPRPGEIRKIAIQQFAHGCDNLLWFRWRTCTAGREQYWHGLLGHDGQPLRRYREAAQTATDLRALETELAGTTVQSEVAIIFDYDSCWAFMFQPGYHIGTKPASEGLWGSNYIDAMRRYYEAFFRKGINVDFIPPEADLGSYKLVMAPHLHILPDTLAARLSEYVHQGGVLFTDCRTAVKDETNQAYPRTLPGLLGAPLGITIEEYEALAEGMEYVINGSTGFPGSFTAQYFADWAKLVTAETLASYGEWHMREFSALTRNQYGKGWGYYAGSLVKESAFYGNLATELLARAGLQATLTPPPGVEVSIRAGANGRLLFLINHTAEEKSLPVPETTLKMLLGKAVDQQIILDRYGVAVLKIA